MTLEPIQSTNISEIGYDPATKRMHVKFHNGAVYEYHDVQQKTYDALMASPSKGKYLHAHIEETHLNMRMKG